MRRLTTITLLLVSLSAHGLFSEESPRSLSKPVVNGVSTSGLPSVGLLLIEEAEGGIGACSGTLIGCRTVLTAAHCFCGAETPGSLCQPNQISAVWFQHGRPSLVSEVRIHADYLFLAGSDLALVKLASPVSGIAPSLINTTGTPAHGSPGLVAGFGLTAGSLADSGIKRAGLVTTASCAVANPSTHICWDFLAPLGPAGEDSSICQGDSGGPLFINFGSGPLVAGVTSGVIPGCLTPNNPWVADVFLDRQWIQENGGADLNNDTCGTLPQAGTDEAPIQVGEGVLNSSNSSETWIFEVPPSTSQLRVAVNGQGPLANDFDLAIRSGAEPTQTQANCRSQGSGALEFCDVFNPTPGNWFARVDRLTGSGLYQLTVTTFHGQSSTGPCVEDADTLCLLDNRFRVEVDWRTPQGTEGKGNAKTLTSDTGYFWFFDENNVEMVIKVLNACSFADRFWVFAGGLTNVEVNIRVTDTERGVTVPFSNPQGVPFQPIQDTNAFATCP